jgi:hypothetical protein
MKTHLLCEVEITFCCDKDTRNRIELVLLSEVGDVGEGVCIGAVVDIDEDVGELELAAISEHFTLVI